MTRVAYVQGRYLPHARAVTHIEDRGYQFADGVYEYCAYYNRRLLDLDLHLARLERSLGKLSIAAPMSMAALTLSMRELIARNVYQDGGIYLQVTRGVARRDHPFPAAAKPVLSMTVCAAKTPKTQDVKEGVSVITGPDIRWGRCDVKSVSLLANILAKQEAASKKARETWLFQPDGIVTEGSVSNAFIVTGKGEIKTHPADEHILPGVTRDLALKLAREAGIPVLETAFTLNEARAAAEAFITSTSANVLPVARIDGAEVGEGAPGPVTRRLMELYHDHIFAQTGKRFA